MDRFLKTINSIKLSMNMRFILGKNILEVHRKGVKLTISGFSSGHFCKVPVVISLHFKVEYFTFWITSLRNEVFVK